VDRAMDRTRTQWQRWRGKQGHRKGLSPHLTGQPLRSLQYWRIQMRLISTNDCSFNFCYVYSGLDILHRPDYTFPLQLPSSMRNAKLNDIVIKNMTCVRQSPLGQQNITYCEAAPSLPRGSLLWEASHLDRFISAILA
jgi:hypothetical protein